MPSEVRILQPQNAVYSTLGNMHNLLHTLIRSSKPLPHYFHPVILTEQWRRNHFFHMIFFMKCSQFVFLMISGILPPLFLWLSVSCTSFLYHKSILSSSGSPFKMLCLELNKFPSDNHTIQEFFFLPDHFPYARDMVWRKTDNATLCSPMCLTFSLLIHVLSFDYKLLKKAPTTEFVL
jgi:hypothetical protein